LYCIILGEEIFVAVCKKKSAQSAAAYFFPASPFRLLSNNGTVTALESSYCAEFARAAGATAHYPAVTCVAAPTIIRPVIHLCYISPPLAALGWLFWV
jgi:hypothetical protein